MKLIFSSLIKFLIRSLQTPRAIALMVLITIATQIGLSYEFAPNYPLDEDFLSAVSEDPSLPVCSGVRADREGISLIPGACLPGQAMVATFNYSQQFIEDESHSARLTGTCCPLPQDAFARNASGAIIYSEPELEECPDGYVAVGGSTASDCGGKCYMSCAKINDEAYMLGEERKAVAWVLADDPGGSGEGDAARAFFKDIPLAYRYAVGREGYDTNYRDLANPYSGKSYRNFFNKDGCVGSPVGSLLVRKVNSSCGGFFFRQLLHKETGKPVKFIPHCDAIEGVYTDSPKCIVNKAWR
jgi:hypothetical protein